MRIAGPWMEEPPTRALMAALGEGALFVGGAVRNTILGRAVEDVDIATPLRPEAVTERAAAAGFRVIPTGIAHGTVTVVAGERAFEVTTFRRDVETDGRRATVAYTDKVREDAERRDFTMNALYAAADGSLVDPLNGFADLIARRVRFVGAPEARIREDWLRILRFFRFHAWYGDPVAGLDPDGLAACAALAEGLDTLSRERVGAEVRRLLEAPDPAPAVVAMAEAGILRRVVPEAGDGQGLAALARAEKRARVAPGWMRRLRLLTAAEVREALRLSNAETEALRRIGAALACADPPAALAARFGAEAARDAILIRAAGGEALLAGWQEEVARGAAAEFPLTAADLMPPLEPGPTLGAALGRLREAWLAADLRLDRQALLALL